MKLKKAKKLPPALYSMLNENVNGCYFLFYLDSNGAPAYKLHTDQPVMTDGFVNRMAATIGALQIKNQLDSELWHKESLSHQGIEDIDIAMIREDDDEDSDDDFRHDSQRQD